MEQKKILIVEDELIIAKDLQRILNLQDWKVVNICATAEKAIQIVEQNPLDLVLIDIILQGKKDGVDLGQFLSDQTEIPFVYITSHSNKDTVRKVTKTAPSGYVLKPFRAEDVTTTIEVVFAREDKKRQTLTDGNLIPLENIPIRLRKVAQHIQENLDKKLRVDSLAEMTSWNTHHFIRNFKKYIGETPYQYILKCKIHKAKKLLPNTNLPISEIATELGFLNHSSFSTAFLKMEKCSPEDYRKRY